MVREMSAPAPVPGAFPPQGTQSLQRFVTCRDAQLEAVLQDWLNQVYVVTDTASAMASRATLPAGAKLVTREGHIYTRHSVSLHAPDSELHGVLSRQREIEALEARAAVERDVLAAGQTQVAEAERAIESHRSKVAVLDRCRIGRNRSAEENRIRAPGRIGRES
jgi:chromosome segregation protein